MRITVMVDGGLVAAPGLAKPINLDDASLQPAERSECQKLVRAALESGHPMARESRMPDARKYRIQIEDDGKTHSLTATDGAISPACADLLNFVREHGSR